ncbi:hypothetical protein MGEO_07630 [Marivita geojedonensis]|uniref:Uncharacterized protein n=1 Tax=Marivita geojedonensis TaxID=1123756 RepID=A0A1X4NM95_9RHOB|nr:hypothetical protein MGEO_07630 [Marivita geojedonensis]PRY78010.1 hypothetical protein CLV76_107197 [Marivita geojedonensis]
MQPRIGFSVFVFLHPSVLRPWRTVAAANVRLGRNAEARSATERLVDQLPHVTIRYPRDCLAPTAVHFDDDYFTHLSIAGIPD